MEGLYFFMNFSFSIKGSRNSGNLRLVSSPYSWEFLRSVFSWESASIGSLKLHVEKLGTVKNILMLVDKVYGTSYIAR